MPMSSHETFNVESAVELAVIERSGFIESRHIGAAVVLAGDGSVVTRLGDIDAPVLARSTLKPFQALASMQSGVPLRGAQVAVACGSHTGSLDHMDVVEGMLKAAGVKKKTSSAPPPGPRTKPPATGWSAPNADNPSLPSIAPASTQHSCGRAPKTAGTCAATSNQTTRSSSAFAR